MILQFPCHKKDQEWVEDGPREVFLSSGHQFSSPTHCEEPEAGDCHCCVQWDQDECQDYWLGEDLEGIYEWLVLLSSVAGWDLQLERGAGSLRGTKWVSRVLPFQQNSCIILSLYGWLFWRDLLSTWGSFNMDTKTHISFWEIGSQFFSLWEALHFHRASQPES
jgi:hypothetical protein